MTPNSPSEGSVVPKTYDELYALYGGLIYKLLYRANKIERNMEDLHAYVWVKLLEANVLERFEDYVQRQMPKVITALEACDFFGISWAQWCSSMCAYHKGYKPTSSSRRNAPRRKGRWMPTPINIAEFEAAGQVGYTSKTALYAYEDIIQLSVDERVLVDGTVRGPFRVMGRKIDKDGNIIGDSREEGMLKIPSVPVTKAQFKNYLTMAVLNHYANFCRTAKRRHKERPVTPHAGDEDAPSWESTLLDASRADADTVLSLAQARRVLSDTLHECADGAELCKPVAEHEVEVFTMLENGASLMQALRESNLPPRVRTAVIASMQDVAPEF